MKTALLLLATLIALPAAATRPITIDLSEPGYEFEGWGVSLCWWAHQVGDWPEERLERLLEEITDPVDGLGLTLFRYNIGGGDDPTHNHMRPGGDVPGFQASPGEPIDPDADPNQRRVLLTLIEQVKHFGGTPILEAFSNSPPYWMTVSGCSSGGEEGGPNLPDDQVDRFANYLADVLQLYRERYGVTFHSLSPFNEPNSTWWKAEHNQEGCQIPEQQQPAVIAATYRALEERGLSTVTGITATESHSIDSTLHNVRSFDRQTLEQVAQINTHTYHGDKRTELRQFATAAGKPLWQSESGPMGLDNSDGDVLVEMIARVALDLNELQPAVWCLWQAIDASDTWGCVRVDRASHTFGPTKSFALYAQFTQAIRPGDRIFPVRERAMRSKVVAARSADNRRVTLVVVNDSLEPAVHRIRLAGVEMNGAVITCTRSTPDLASQEVAGASQQGDLVTIKAIPHSVTTVTVTVRAADEAFDDLFG